MLNFALVGIDDDTVRGNTEEVLVESDNSNSDAESSAVNSFQFNTSSENIIFDELTMQDQCNISMVKLMQLKNEIYELKNENFHLRKVISEFMAEKISKSSEGIIVDHKAKLSQLRKKNKVILRRNCIPIKETQRVKSRS